MILKLKADIALLSLFLSALHVQRFQYQNQIQAKKQGGHDTTGYFKYLSFSEDVSSLGLYIRSSLSLLLCHSSQQYYFVSSCAKIFAGIDWEYRNDIVLSYRTCRPQYNPGYSRLSISASNRCQYMLR